MKAEKELADKVVEATLKHLRESKQWSDHLADKIEMLYTTNSLSDISMVSKAFEEVAVTKEGDLSD